MPKKFKVRNGCSVQRPLTSPSIKKYNCTKTFVTTGSMVGCGVPSETQFVGTRLRLDTIRAFSAEATIPTWGAAGDRSEFNIKPPLGAPNLSFPYGYLLRPFPQVDASARQRGFEIRVFPLLGVLPKAIASTMSNTRWPSYATLSRNVVHIYIYLLKPSENSICGNNLTIM